MCVFPYPPRIFCYLKICICNIVIVTLIYILTYNIIQQILVYFQIYDGIIQFNNGSTFHLSFSQMCDRQICDIKKQSNVRLGRRYALLCPPPTFWSCLLANILTTQLKDKNFAD